MTDALQLADLMYFINAFPCPVMARVNGTALGGGVGLIATSDIAIAVEGARFAFSEVKLGIAPAVISPYVVRKIGETTCTGIICNGRTLQCRTCTENWSCPWSRATRSIWMTQYRKLERTIEGCSPGDTRRKTLALNVSQMTYEQARHYTAQMIAHLRVGEEGQEGLHAFLEKRDTILAKIRSQEQMTHYV